MRTDNVALMERGYEAFTTGDMDTIREMSAADCAWHTPGFGPMLPEYRGVDSVISYLSTLFEQTDGTFKDEPEAFFTEEDKVVVLEHVTGSRKGKTLDTHVLHVFEVHDGKVVEATEYAAEPHKLEDFWA